MSKEKPSEDYAWYGGEWRHKDAIQRLAAQETFWTVHDVMIDYTRDPLYFAAERRPKRRRRCSR